MASPPAHVLYTQTGPRVRSVLGRSGRRATHRIACIRSPRAASEPCKFTYGIIIMCVLLVRSVHIINSAYVRGDDDMGQARYEEVW